MPSSPSCLLILKCCCPGVLLAMLDIKELEYFVVDMVKKAKILKFRVDGKTQDIKTIYK